MSDVRLQNKLVQAGFIFEDLEGMDMLDKYAELVLAGKEPVTSKSAPALVGYDVA